MVKTTLVCRAFLFLSLLAIGAIGPVKADDGWRRTAHGWERSHAWQAVPVSKPVIATNSSLPHPGQLAALEVVVSCLVLGLFVPSCLRAKRESP
jgi:hypothetical protein